MTHLLTFLAAAIALITAMAMLQDANLRPGAAGARGWLRHGARLLGLIGVCAAAGVLLVVPHAQHRSLYQGVFDLALACLLAMQSPCPWWRYVWRGDGGPHSGPVPPTQGAPQA